KPLLWVIVDDGSCDRTPEMIRRFATEHDWIRVHTLRRDRDRLPGTGVIHAFRAGLELISNQEYDFIVKLDGDLKLPPDYFERLLKKFHEDQRLGIASGVYLERRDDEWHEIRMPEYHAAGASKMIRAACFEQIGGFVPSRGWDTVDEIHAQTHNWKT